MQGASDFTSARLYTMIQEGTTNTPISAIQAAIDTKTTLLLGLWASQDQAGFNNELAALSAAITQYGTAFTDLVTGISVGSEDLYRISPTGIAAGSGYGQEPSVLVNYIAQTRNAIKGTALGSKPVGHVDTWNVYVNGSNSAVISASDFLGLDEYPYYQTTDVNPINNASFLFFQAYDRVAAVAGGKPIWVTEAGWPVSGPTSGQAVPSVANAETFWQQVACELEHRGVNFWWYILNDQGASPSFGVSTNGVPLYNLACNATSGYSSSSSSAAASSTASASASGSSSVRSSTLSTSKSASSGASSAAASGSASATGAVSASASHASSAAATATATASRTASSGASSASSSGPATFTGAASKVEGSIAALALGAVAAVLAL